MKQRSRTVVRLIAAFRFIKSIFLIITAAATLHIVRAGSFSRVIDMVKEMPWASQHAFIQRAIAKITRLPPKRIEEFAIVLILYAALFMTEAVGLWMDKVWAEWLTIVATASFIPFEVYETLRGATPYKVGLLCANVAILVYLIWRRATDRGRGNPATRVLRRFS